MRLIVMIAFLLSGTVLCKTSTNEKIHFFIMIPTYNNASRCIDNIQSVIMQTYPHWIACIIDDASDDDTYNILKTFIEEHGLGEKIILIRKEHRSFALHNIYDAVHEFCDDFWILVFLDGDDALLHTQVFERLLKEYRKKEVWVTYGNYIKVPPYELGICRPYPEHIIKKADFRSYDFICSHLRTCRAWLFKLIDKKDLCDEEGNFFETVPDVALMYPLLEMAHKGHIVCINDLLYMYRIYENNEIKRYPEKMAQTLHYIQNQKKYSALSEEVNLIPQKKIIILCSYNQPQKLYSTLLSIKDKNIYKIYIFYQAYSKEIESQYKMLQRKFPFIKFIKKMKPV